MTENITEYLRKRAITDLFKMDTFSKAWPTWKIEVNKNINHLSATNVVNLGDKLGDIFRLTSVAGRSQSAVSGAGNAWEAIVCWYLNLCLIGSRTVVVKQKKSLIPEPIRQALTVSYGTFPSGTESDLIAITFPDKADYLNNKLSISIRGEDGELIPTVKGRNNEYNYKSLIDALMERDFSDCEIGVIQCKTNWNDNAQIPMLWDMIYSSSGFRRHSISVGTSTFSINHVKNFTYSFVTVPTVERNKITSSSTAVKRVQNLSGGNYWGYPSKPSVANSLKDIFGRNFSAASSISLSQRLTSELPKLSSKYPYFNLK